MRFRWFDILFALAATLNPSPCSAAVIPLSSPPKPQSTFYINKPVHLARQVSSSASPGAPQAAAVHKLYVESSDSRTRLENWILEDFVLVPTVEGDLYALDRHTGATKWVLDGQGPAVQAVPIALAENATNETSTERVDQQARWIVEPVDGGQLYLFDKQFGLLQLSLTVKELIDHAPFSIPGDDKVYTGRKDTQFMAVDSRTGQVLSRYGNRGAAVRGAKCLEPKALKDPDDHDDQCDVLGTSQNILMIGKTVYHLTIASAQESWDVTYTEWTPNMIDSHLSEQYVKVLDDLYICPSSDGEINICNPTQPPLWTKILPSSAINAFDVFRPAFKDPSMFKDPPSLVLIRQPPNPYFHRPPEDRVMAFLNTTMEGAWYALSTDRFPRLAGRVEPAPWATCHAAHNETHNPEEYCNMTRSNLVGIHPIAKTLDMNIDDGLPSPGLIDGGHHHGKYRESSLFVLVAIAILVFGYCKRRALIRGTLFRGLNRAFIVDGEEILEESIESIPLTEKLPEDEMPLAGPSTREDMSASPANDPNPSNPEKKRRKRGQRGGRNGKKKVPEPMAEVDVGEYSDKHPLIGSTSADAKELSAYDHATHTIDGLTITDNLLGSGSQGTFVYEGTWEGIRVAVKRMQLENFQLAEKEINHLRESDEHPNIIRYYTNKRNDKFIYIALELCPATLEEIIAHPHDDQLAALAGENLPKQYALAQIASGLQFLHSLHIVHRDLKPQNILVAPAKLRGATLTKSPLWRHYKPDLTRCLISDFGLGRKLEPGHSTFQAHSNGAAGTCGWRAPEVLRGIDKGKGVSNSNESSPLSTPSPEYGSRRRITRAVDIFSMGCLFYYVLTDGEHPFGNRTYLRDGRILDNDFDLSALDCTTSDGVEARDLVSRMILPNPHDRPNASEVLEHPYFWSEKRRMDFILEFSDRLNKECRDPPSLVVQRVESTALEICGLDWTRVIDDAFMKDSRVNRSYDGTKVNDLVRLIRNKKNHNHDLPDTLRRRLNEFEPGGYIGYFLYKRFPKLLLHLYYISQEVGWSYLA